MKEPINVSTSGGRSSMFMARLFQTSTAYLERYDPVFLFCNTGKEREETLEFVRDAEIHWGLPVVWLEAVVHPGKKSCTHRIVSFDDASRKGEPFEAVIKKYGIPNKSYRHCTRELKQHVMASYMRSLGHNSWASAIGFRFDEPSRMSGSTQWGPAVYPLYDLCLRRQQIRLWWREQPFDLKIEDYEGNCDLCFAKNLTKKVRIAREQPGALSWWQDMEERYGTDDRKFDIRDCVSMDKLAGLASDETKDLPTHSQQEFPCMCSF